MKCAPGSNPAEAAAENSAKERQSLSADGSNLTGNPLQTSKYCFEITVLKRRHNLVDTVQKKCVKGKKHSVLFTLRDTFVVCRQIALTVNPANKHF